MTPSTVHEGRVKAVATKRLETMEKAFKQFPERFSRGIKVQLPATEVGSISLRAVYLQSSTYGQKVD